MHDCDQKPVKLIVAETPTRLLWAYDIQGPGKVANKVKWGQLPRNLPFISAQLFNQ